MQASANNHIDTLKLLLKAGAKIDHTDTTLGWTALIWTAKEGHTAAARILLERGADPGIKDYGGNTALHWAVLKGHLEVVELLQQYGSNPLDVDRDGNTALAIATQNNQQVILSRLAKAVVQPEHHK